MNALVVTKYKNGTLLRSNEGSERASIYVTQKTLVNRGGSIWEQTRVGHLRLPKAIAESLNVKEGEDLNPKLATLGLGAHTVIMKESTEAFYPGQSPKIIPGKDGADDIIIKDDNGNAIYQDYAVVPAEGAKDQLVARTLAGSEAKAESAPAEQGDLA